MRDDVFFMQKAAGGDRNQAVGSNAAMMFLSPTMLDVRHFPVAGATAGQGGGPTIPDPAATRAAPLPAIAATLSQVAGLG
jgi:hypothetical protein